jgi:DNA (cytosine-5)-methyltransferase 1
VKFVDEHSHDPKRVFLSDESNDNQLESIVSKVNIVQIDPKVGALVQNCVNVSFV